MKTTIDKAGRIVIPSAIRDRARLRPGAPLDVSFEDGAVRITRKVPRPKLVRFGRILIAKPSVPPSELPPLDVAALIEEERNRWPL